MIDSVNVSSAFGHKNIPSVPPSYKSERNIVKNYQSLVTDWSFPISTLPCLSHTLAFQSTKQRELERINNDFEIGL